jgi:hypothetical protein
MRFAVTLVIALLVQTPQAGAQEVAASGAIGAGIHDDAPSSLFDVGVDVQGQSYRFGIGARLHFQADSGFREQDWDDPSELASIVRYALYQRDAGGDEIAFAFAAGELGYATLGHGALIHSLSGGLDVDHRHLGMHMRSSYGALSGEAIVDDVVAPRVIAATSRYRLGDHVGVDASAATDISAPTMMGTSKLLALSAGPWLERSAFGDTVTARAFIEGVGLVGYGGGVHAGCQVNLSVANTTAMLRAEVTLGSDKFLPSYFGPLYERARVQFDGMGRTQLDRVKSGGLAGAGGQVTGEVESGLVRAHAGWANRPGLGDLVYGGLALASHTPLQLGLGAAMDFANPTAGVVGAAEARVRLPGLLFVAVEGARLFRVDAQGVLPVWSAHALIGASFGD